ncbi:MAG: hypothetical protein Q4F57_02480 [Weeksellaceae bacterium]|nr:hypothetical protein [Weeksellaceae bacterium]
MTNSRLNSYQRIHQYFAHIVQDSRLLQGYAGFSSTELRQKTNSLTGLPSPFLHLWKYEKGLLGTSPETTMAVVNVGYAIFRNDVAVDDFEAQYAAIDQCEQLAHHVCSRLRYDANNPQHFLFNAFLKDRTRIEPVSMQEVGYGVEVQVYFQNPESLKLHPQDWHSIDRVC